MRLTTIPAAALALCVLAACGGSAARVLPQGAAPALRTASAPAGVLARIVGVGDSLTAGYQAQGFLGQTGYPNPRDKGKTVPPTQENGWWADIDEQASGLSRDAAIAREYDPATSPLPLIAAPGLDNQVVQSFPQPLDTLKLGNACSADGGFNEAGYRLSDLSRVRMNAASTTIRNVAVPGITLHEAVTMFEPQSSTCQSIPGVPGLLSEVVADESGTFWPVLGSFAKMGTGLSMVKAAASLRPTLATVWLGANDVLKYMGSGGRFVGADNSASQAQSDVRAAILPLQRAGAKVVVANLPNLLETPYFQLAELPATQIRDCYVRTYLACVFEQFYIAKPNAVRFVRQIVARYHLATPNGCKPASTTSPCGYLTLSGTLDTVEYLAGVYYKGQKTIGVLPDLDCTGPHFTKPCTPGSGLGAYYITPAFAAKIQTLNDAINAGIGQAAASTGSALVDVRAIFDGIASGNAANPYFHQAATIAHRCCTLSYAVGLVSFDGLHPSNTGYALLANSFIQTINAKFGTHVAPIDLHAVYAGTRCTTARYCYPDPYAPPHNGIITF